MFSTTPATAKGFFDGNIDNGTASRVNLCTIVKEDVERRPKFGHYDATFDKKLAVFLARLDSAKGMIVCQQAKRLAETLLDRAEERALMMGNESYTQFSYRAVVIAFRKSILLYIMCGMKWTKEIEDFIIEEYNVLERAECPDTKQRGNLLAQWKRRGWVELNEDLKVYVKTQNYYQKHAA